MAVDGKSMGLIGYIALRMAHDLVLSNYLLIGPSRAYLDGIMRGEDCFEGLAEKHASDIRAAKGFTDVVGPFTDYGSYRDHVVTDRCLGRVGHAFRNRLGITDDKDMQDIAGTLAVSAFAEFAVKGFVPDPDTDGFRSLHKAMFRSWFPWAGEFRTLDIPDGAGDPYPDEPGVPWREIPDGIDAALESYRALSGDGIPARSSYEAVWLGLTRPRPFLFGGWEAAATFLALDYFRRMS